MTKYTALRYDSRLSSCLWKEGHLTGRKRSVMQGQTES